MSAYLRGWTRAQIEQHILQDAKAIRERPESGGYGKDGWFKPMHVGGWDSGPHSAILQKLVKQGVMEMRWWGRARAYRLIAKSPLG